MVSCQREIFKNYIEANGEEVKENEFLDENLVQINVD